MAETLLTIVAPTVPSARPSHGVSAPPWDGPGQKGPALLLGSGPLLLQLPGYITCSPHLGTTPDICLDTLLSTLRSRLSDTDDSGAASVSPQHPSLLCMLLTLPNVEGHPPPGPQASHRARKPALTELTLEAKVPPDLVDPHHRGISDFLQDIRQDFWRFYP